MIVAKLKISYDRGTAFNKKADLGSNVKRGDALASGGIVRGLGSHFRSKEIMESAQARDKEANRIYKAFREKFLTTTIDGLYIVTAYGVAKEFVANLNPVGIDVRVAEFELTSSPGLDAEELAAWGSRIKRQLGTVGLGRKKEIDEGGIRAVNALASCPLLSQKTQNDVKNLVSLLETAKINRADFKKRLDGLEIEVNQIDKAHDAKAAKLEEKADWVGDHVPA